jgi:hypothetical protein
MAYTQAITQADMTKIILKMLGLLRSGGTPSTAEYLEGGWVINAAIRSLDSAGWFRQRISHASVSLTAGNNYVNLATDVISVETGFLFNTTGGEIGTPIIVTSASEAYRNGPLETHGIPTHCWVKVEEQATDTVSVAYFNRKAYATMTFEYFYRAATAVMPLGVTAFTLGDEWLRLVMYLSSINWARMNEIDPSLIAELQANLQIAADLAASGQYVLDPSVIQDLMIQQGPQKTGGAT